MMSVSKRSVLLVDDSKVFTEVFFDYFTLNNAANIEITGVANSGIEAVKLIQSLQPDFVLLDISMPHYSGYHVLDNIASMHLQKKPQVIMMTGMSMNNSIQESLNLGAVGYIEKPFEIDKVISMLSRL